MSDTASVFPFPTMREYQVKAVENWFLKPPSSIINLPTGLGKTLTCAHLFREFIIRTGGTCLFLAHTDELIRQTCRTMLRMGIHPRVEKSMEYKGDPYAPSRREVSKLFPTGMPHRKNFIHDKVYVSSMQTFIKRMDKYPDGFGLLTIDECHMSRCSTYEKIVAEMIKRNPAMLMLGLTATPMRGDKKNLGKIFPEFAFQYDLNDAINDGYLVPVVSKRAELIADDSKWKSSFGKDGSADLTAGSLEDSMNQDSIESIAHEILDHGEDRKGIVFLPGQASVEAVCHAINCLKPGYATYVHGGITDRKERRRRVDAFQDGKYRQLVGCNIFTTGFDDPEVSLLTMARPTKSMGLYIQMLGRGLRTLAHAIEGKNTPQERREGIQSSDKKDCLVIDFTKNSSKHKLLGVLDIILSGYDPAKLEFGQKIKKPKDDKEEIVKEKVNIHYEAEVISALYELEEDLNQTGWKPPRLNYVLTDVNIFGAGGNQKESKKLSNKKPSSKQVKEAFQFLINQSMIDSMTAGQLQSEIDRRKTRMVSRTQYGMLMRNGIDPKEHKMNYEDADYIRRLIGGTPGQKLPEGWYYYLQNNREKREKRKRNGK